MRVHLRASRSLWNASANRQRPPTTRWRGIATVDEDDTGGSRARQFYYEGLSTVQIGKPLGLGPSTIGKALKRAGVAMRPAAAERWGVAE